MNQLATRNRITKVWGNSTARRAIKSTIILVPATLFIVLQTPIKINTSIEGKAGLEIVIGHELVDTVEVVTPALSSRQDLDKATDIETWPAFPGAEGYGGNATWGLKPTFRVIQASVFGFPIAFKFVGKAGTILGAAAPNDSVCDRTNANVHFVTNTNASGAGSFRDIIENQLVDDIMDFVIFRVGGTQSSASDIRISESCIYIAGQSAPGDGFQVYSNGGRTILTNGSSDTGDFIVRYLRITSDKSGPGPDAIGLDGGHDMMWDHISVSFGNDEVFSIVGLSKILSSAARPHKDITVQWTIIGPGLRPHSTGSLFAAHKDSSNAFNRLSLHHNLWIHTAHRNPALEHIDSVQVINNVVHNWRNSGMIYILPWHMTVDFVRNYYRQGPWTGGAKGTVIIRDAYLPPPFPAPPGDAMGKVYMIRNIADDALLDSLGDQKTVTVDGDIGGQMHDTFFVASAYTSPSIPITEYSAAQALDSVLNLTGTNTGVGAFLTLTCAGAWQVKRDALDALLIQDAIDGTGPGSADTDYDDPDDFGGVPTFASGTACTDTDSDGMPDVWEDANGLDKNDGTDFTSDNDGDGYIALEEYLNGTTP